MSTDEGIVQSSQKPNLLASENSTKVGILIVGYNAVEFLDRCLSSLSWVAERSGSVRVFLCDNASPDPEVKKVVQKYPLVDVVWNSENSGFAAGQNLLLERADLWGATHCIALNPDMVFAEESFEHILGEYLRLEADPTVKVGVLAPMLVNAEGHVEDNTVKNYSALTLFLEMIFGKRMPEELQNPSGETVKVYGVSGGCVIYSLNVVKRDGYYDRAFFMYFEDTEWAIRLNEAGYTNYLATGVKLFHGSGRSWNVGDSKEADAWKFRVASISIIEFAKKRFTLLGQLFIMKWVLQLLVFRLITRRISWQDAKLIIQKCYNRS